MRASRRDQLDTIGALNREQVERQIDPEIETRIAQYEMAYRMQASVPGADGFARRARRHV